MPYKTFFLLAATIDDVDATTELLLVRAVSLGYALCHAGSDNKKTPQIKAAHRDLIRRAYPQVPDQVITDG